MTEGAAGDSPAGAALFARFAFPPNSLGYCGPADSGALLVAAGLETAGKLDVEELRRLARRFEGAWPYLQLIAAASGIADPLDAAVVEAYWIGSPLLKKVPLAKLGELLTEGFRLVSGAGGRDPAAVLVPGARPHHNFHVFSVYPWVGLLKGGRVPEPLTCAREVPYSLGRGRGRGRRHAGGEGPAAVLDWVVVGAGNARAETVPWRSEAGRFIDAPVPGQWVAMHWDWVCDVLRPDQVKALHEQTNRQLAIVNGSGANGSGAAASA